MDMSSSDGYFHCRLYFIFVPIAGFFGLVLSSFLGVNFLLASGLAMLGCLLSVVINSDLDQDGLVSAKTIFMKIPVFGVTLSGLWIAIWGVYSSIVPHRSPVSHWPVLGTLGRMAYLYTTLQALLVVTNALQGRPYSPWIPTNLELWFLIGVGLECGSVSHFLRDWYGLQL